VDREKKYKRVEKDRAFGYLGGIRVEKTSGERTRNRVKWIMERKIGRRRRNGLWKREADARMERDRIFRRKEILRKLKKMKYRKAVPEGSVPKEAYQIIAQYDYGLGGGFVKKMEGIRR
jgi:hypothetical protein